MDENSRVDPNWAHVVNLYQNIYDDDIAAIENNTQCLTPNGISAVGSVNEGSVLLGASGEPVNVLSRGTTVISKVIKVTATLSMGRAEHIRKTTFFVTHNQPLQLAAAAACHANLKNVGGRKRRVTWWTRCTQDGIHEEVASLPYEAALDAIAFIIRQNSSNLRGKTGEISMSAAMAEIQTNNMIQPHLVKAFECWCQANDFQSDDGAMAGPLNVPEWLTELEQQLTLRFSNFEEIFKSTTESLQSNSDDTEAEEDDEELDFGSCPDFLEFISLEAACNKVDSQATDSTFHPEMSFSPPGSQESQPTSSQFQPPSASQASQPPSSQFQPPSSQFQPPSSQFQPPSASQASQPPSSQQISQHEDQSAQSQNSAATFRSAQRESFEASFRQLRNTLKPCSRNCMGLRQMSKLFPDEEQAELVTEILNSSLYSLIDPYQVHPGDLFQMTAGQLIKSCNPQQLKLVIGQDPLHAQGIGTPLPMWAPDPYFMGLWLGDGRKDDATIASSEEETKAWLQDYVNRLNKNWPGPPFKKLRLREDQIFHEDKAAENGWKLAFNYAIANERSGARDFWNPVRTALSRFGLLHDKSGGVPDIYKQATKDDQLKVIAGLMDSDGSLKKACYTLEQVGDDHKKMVYDVAELCSSLGIRHGGVHVHPPRPGSTKKHYVIHITGEGIARISQHVCLPRKKVPAIHKFYSLSAVTITASEWEEALWASKLQVEGGVFQTEGRVLLCAEPE